MPMSENKLQWIAIAMTAVGLGASAFYSTQALRVARLESELATFLQLNDRYNKLLFTLIQNDSEVFKKTDDATLKDNKYLIYEIFELFSTIKGLEGYFSELDKDVWPIWEKRTQFFFSKPAIRYAWHLHMNYAEAIYKKEFVTYIEEVISESKSNSL